MLLRESQQEFGKYLGDGIHRHKIDARNRVETPDSDVSVETIVNHSQSGYYQSVVSTSPIDKATHVFLITSGPGVIRSLFRAKRYYQRRLEYREGMISKEEADREIDDSSFVSADSRVMKNHSIILSHMLKEHLDSYELSEALNYDPIQLELVLFNEDE